MPLLSWGCFSRTHGLQSDSPSAALQGAAMHDSRMKSPPTTASKTGHRVLQVTAHALPGIIRTSHADSTQQWQVYRHYHGCQLLVFSEWFPCAGTDCKIQNDPAAAFFHLYAPIGKLQKAVIFQTVFIGGQICSEGLQRARAARRWGEQKGSTPEPSSIQWKLGRGFPSMQESVCTSHNKQ